MKRRFLRLRNAQNEASAPYAWFGAIGGGVHAAKFNGQGDQRTRSPDEFGQAQFLKNLYPLMYLAPMGTLAGITDAK